VTSRALLLLPAFLLFAGCSRTPPPHAGKPTPQAEMMRQMLADVKTLRSYGKGVADQGQAETAASDLVRLSNRLETLFPPEIAHQYVELTPDMIRGGITAMRDLTEPLLGSVRAQDREGAALALSRTERDGCGFCHLHGYE